jgi:uroporphyrinogen III methyltransferase/synthase
MDRAPLDAAVRDLATYDWLILTSANGVNSLFNALREAKRDARAFGSCKVAVIGPATSARLADFGIRADIQPATFTTAAVVEALAARDDLKGKRVLCARADIANPDLTKALGDRGAVVTDVVAYRTVQDNSECAKLANMIARGEIDWLTFTSSSTVSNLLASVSVDAIRNARARVASIGPVTTAELRRLGLSPTVEAAEHTIPGLLAAIVQFETRQGNGRS